MIEQSVHESSASSFTDLMASLMVIFVLLFVAQLNNASVKGRSARDDILAELRKRLNAIGLGETVRQDATDKNAIVIVVPDSLLFDKGSRVVRPSGDRALHQLVPLIAQVVCAPIARDNIQTVVVEGHTDTTWAFSGATNVNPEHARELNLELSQGRSMEVVKISLASLGEPDLRTCIRRLLSASGRGQEEPLRDVPGDDARQRRVIFKIRVVTNAAGAIAGSVGSSARVETLAP